MSSEWVKVEEDKYDELIPLYKRRMRISRVSAWVMICTVFVILISVDMSIVVTIVFSGLVCNLFLWLMSQSKILDLKILIMENIRAGTIDQLLE